MSVLGALKTPRQKVPPPGGAFLNGNIRAKWSKDIAGNIAKANTNWSRIHGTPVERL